LYLAIEGLLRIRWFHAWVVPAGPLAFILWGWFHLPGEGGLWILLGIAVAWWKYPRLL